MNIKQALKLQVFIVLLTGTNCMAQSYAPVWDDKRVVVKPIADIKAYAFNLEDIQLLPGPFAIARDADVSYLLKIDPDRLLADFRVHSDLKPKGERYGGWESSGLAGHTLGHYLSALALHYASTGDKEFLKRVNYIVDELGECQLARKTGYLGAIPNEDSVWNEIAKGNIRSRGFDLNGAWSPWYTFHKIMSGLLDAYLYCNNQEGLQLARRMADWTATITGNLSDSLVQKMLITEYGGMNDALVNIYSLTGDKKYLDLSYRFYDRRIMDSLAAGINILPGKHSNTQIPKIIGSDRRYQLTSNEKDNATARFFWQTIVNHHSYATGGNSNYEYLRAPDSLNNELTDNTTETCNTYNMLKLTRELFSTAPSSTLMDYYERALYNHILSSQNHQTGMMTYFVSLRMGGRKEYSDEFNSFTCCVGTGMENHVKYGESIYSRGKDGSLYVNLFIPSVLNWKEKGLSIKQQTDLPASDRSVFTIQASQPSQFTIRLRKPHWAKHVVVKVNGVPQATEPGTDGYIPISRQWKNNDSISFITPMDLYAVSMPDNPKRCAVFYGPVLLAGILGDKEPGPLDIPVFVTSQKDANQWVEKRPSNPLVFQAKNNSTTSQVVLKPFNQTADEYYTVYWDVFTPGEWIVQRSKYEAQKRYEKQLEARTTDVLRIGEMQPERDHELNSEKSTTGTEHNRKWRMTEEDGFISFNMKIDPSALNTLVLTYWGMDNRGRIFDIYVNETRIATEDLNKFKQSRFYDIAYPVPQELTKYKLNATIRLVAKKGNAAGPVYGVKMIRGEVNPLP